MKDNWIEPATTFIDALEKAHNLLKLENTTRIDIKSSIKFFSIAARKIGFDKYEIQDVKRKHLIQMFEVLPTLKKSWSAWSYNNSRSYLMMIYRRLLLMEAVESNPVKDIPKQQVTIKRKHVLTFEQRVKINEYLFTRDHDYWRFINIFFHSGCRRTELCRLKVGGVDLSSQEFTILVIKGKQPVEHLKAIKNIAMKFWEDQLEGAKGEDYAFSSTFKPGRYKLQPKNITKKWKLYVKDELKIDIDFYALKHLNLDETSSQLNAEAAAKMAGHTSTVITMKHYLINEEQRELEKLKKLNNKFA